MAHTLPRKQTPSSNDDQWYVSRNEKEYGPLPFNELAQFAKQGRLTKQDWVWKPGLASWVAAGELFGLFSEISPQRRHHNVGEIGVEPKSQSNFKTRAKEQIRDFLLMFLYLWIVFGMMTIHKFIILSQHQINYAAHGFAVINALVFAKVMLLAEDFHLGRRTNEKPLIYAVIFKSVLFAIALICFHIVEHVLIRMWHGKPVAASIAKSGADSLVGIVFLGIIGTVSLAPFFLLSEISRVIGRDNLWALFFQRRSVK